MKLKMLAECDPLELIRVNLGAATEWAIVGVRKPEEFPLVVLTGEGAPRVVHTLGDMGLNEQFSTRPVLSYGNDQTLFPLEDAPCDVHDGPIFQRNGALIFTNDSEFLRCLDRDAARFLDLKTGVLRTAPSGHKAAFAEWNVWTKDNPNRAVLVCTSS